jgi:predicted nucleic acid-binding protein
MPAFVDSNVLLYLVSTTASEASKRSTARTILDRDDLVLSAQVRQS